MMPEGATTNKNNNSLEGIIIILFYFYGILIQGFISMPASLTQETVYYLENQDAV